MTYIFAILGYLIGSIPFGLVLTKLAGYGDIRAIGSGNIGATNVLRTGNKKLALAVLILDGLKGVAAVALARSFAPWGNTLVGCHDFDAGYSFIDTITNNPPEICAALPLSAMMAAGFFSIIGHMFPVWLKFKGGKGVATAIGMLLALAPYVGLSVIGVWLAMAVIFRYSSLAALTGMLAAPFAAHFIYGHDMLTGLCGFLVTLIWFKHRANIQRLVKGEEPKIGKKKQ